MPVPIGEVGAYAGSGGVIVLVAMKLLPLLFKKRMATITEMVSLGKLLSV